MEFYTKNTQEDQLNIVNHIKEENGYNKIKDVKFNSFAKI